MQKFLLKSLLLVLLACMPWVSSGQVSCASGQLSCTITVSMDDAYEDGWNGASLLVYQDTILRATLSITGGAESQTVAVCADSVRFQWSSGSWDDECSFVIYNGDGSVMYTCTDGSSLSTSSAFYTGLVNCPTCPTPTNFQALSVGTDYADLSWVEMGGATSWVLEYDDAPFTPGNSVGTVEYPTDTAYTLSNLDLGTTYYVYLHADCGSGDTSINTYCTFTTLAAAPATMPFSCTFEDTTASNAGWDLYGQNQTNYWTVGTATHNAGERALYVTDNGTSNSYSTGSTSYSHAVRVLDIENAGEYSFSYDWKGQGESHYYDFTRVFLAPASYNVVAGTLPVGSACYAFATGTLPTGFIDLTVSGAYPNTLASNNTWTTASGTFQIANAGTYKLVFAWANDASGGSQPPTAIDNVMIQQNTCPAPTLTISAVGSDNAILDWVESGSATDYELFYGPAGFSRDTATANYVNDTTYTIQGLTPNTDYTVYLRGICGYEDSSLWVVANFRTACIALDSLPYTQNFENESTGSSSTSSSFADCWTRLNNGTMYGGYPYISSSSTYNHTSGGSKGLYWYNSTTTGTYGDYQCIVFPMIDTEVYPADTLQVGFWAKASSTSYHPVFEVGVMTSPTDINTFVPVDTVNVSGTTWQEFEVPLRNYTGDGAFVAVRATRSTAYWYAYVDDFTLMEIPSCTKPQTIVADSIVGDTAYISWSDNNPSNTTWEITYGAVGYTPDENSTIISGITTTNYMLTGLTMGASYDIYVRTDCGSEQSIWQGPVSVMAGYFYAMNTTGTDTLRGCGYIITDDGGATGSYSASCNATLYLLPPDSTQTFIISGSSYSESYYDYVRIYDGIGTSGVQLYNDYGVTARQNFGPFTSDEGAITIVFHSDGSVAYDGFQIATQCVAASSCTRPNQLTFSNVTDQSVDVSWNERGTATSWNIEYGPSGFTTGTGTTVVASSTTETLTGLTPNTLYDVYLQADCGSELSTATVGSFRTACVPIDSLPYFYGFEGTTASSTGTIDACWKKGVVGTTTAYPYPSSIAATGSRSLYFYGYLYSSVKSYAVLPLFNDSLSDLQISFKMRASQSYSYYGADLTLGVCTNADDISTFTPIQTYTATSTTTWDTFTCYLAAYQGTGRYITFLAEAPGGSQYYDYVYLDDVEVDYAPECGPVTDVAVNAGPASAIITWTPSAVGTYAGATVNYKLDGDASWTTVNTTDSYVVITGLDADTTYNYTVTNTCEDGMGQSVAGSFQTLGFPCAVFDTTTYINDTVGNGSTTSSYFPSYSFYCHGLTQQIFRSSDFTSLTSGVITHLGYEMGNVSQNRTIDVYLTNTTLNTLTSFVSVASTDLVWSGTLSTSDANSWVDLVLSSSFNYTGGNILVTFNDHTGSYVSGNNSKGSNVTSGISRYVYQDGSAYSATNPPSGGTSSSFRMNMAFFGGSCLTPATCVAPVVAAPRMTATTAEIVWAPGNTESSWDVYYKLSSDANYTLAGTATTNNYTISNLQSGSVYDFKVVSSCEGNPSCEVEGTTECAAISSLPFTETFDSWGTGSGVLPNCWSREGSYSTYPYISASTGAGYDNTTGTGHSVYMYTYANSTAGTFFIMPEIDSLLGNVNQMQAVFYLNYPYSSSYTFGVVVGVCEGTYSTFVPVDTVVLSTTGTTNWEVFEVPLSNYTGTGRNLMFKAYSGASSYSYPYLDDITIEYIPTCPRPDSLSASNATTSSIDLSWHERGSATQWIIEYGQYGFQLGTGTTVVANTNPFTLTGIPSSMDGEFYVRSVCSSTDTGYYSRRGCRFSTPQIPATLPYSYNYETATEYDNWQISCNNNNYTWYRGTAEASEGSYGLYVTYDQGVTASSAYSSVVNLATYRDIDFGTVDSSFTISFDAKVGGTITNSYDGLMVFLVDPSLPTVASNSGITSPWGSVNDLYRIASIRVDTTWQTYQASFDTISGVHRVAFFWFNQSTSYYSHYDLAAAIDNIEIDYSPCPRPLALEVDTSTLTSTTAELNWMGPANATYQIIYRVAGSSAADNNYVTSLTNSKTLTGLDPLTNYYCWVRKICGTDTSLTCDGISFQTKMCDGAVDITFGDTNSSIGTSYNVPVNNFYNYTACEIIIDSAELQGQTEFSAISFYYAGSSASSYKNDVDIYLMPTTKTTFSGSSDYQNVDSSTAVLVYSGPLNCEQGWNLFGFDTTYFYAGTGNIMIVLDDNSGDYDGSSYTFRTVSTTGNKTLDCYSDTYNPDVYALGSFSGSKYARGFRPDMKLISCPSNACPQPVITGTTGNYASATMTWTSNATSFEVSYKAAADGSWNTEVAVNDAYTYTFTGLTPQTAYQLRVRAICDTESVSEWAMTEFTTAELPCFAPTNFTTGEVSFTNANFTWTPGTSETHWAVRIWNTTYDSTYTFAGQPAAAVSGLVSNVTYNAAVRALCGDNGEVPSENWSDTINFTTTLCDPVTAVSNTVNGLSATITWTPGANNNGAWEVRYGVTGFAQGDEIGTIPTTTNTATVDGLEAYMTYDAYVRAKCAEGAYSAWSTKTSFYVDATGIHTIDGENNVSIYPNPATGNTNISLAGIAGNVTLTIVDMNGRTVRTEKMECDGTCVKVVNVEALASGAYFVRVSSDSYNAVKKLIVK